MKTCPKCSSQYENTVGFCPKDGEVLEEASKNIVGQTLDNQYEIEAFIAQGGMGAVYRARHILLGDRVVIKTMRDEVRNNAEFLRRFQREGRAARAFRHPNSVTVYDLRTASDGMIYMVMEYVEGHTLDKELKERGRFTPKEALDVLEPVASVLDAAHARGVVHRDLKPENVMIGTTQDGGKLIKVLDLGIAKMTGVGDTPAPEGTSLTIAGQILGTPYYMSPEQWGEIPRDGKPDIDGRADIYSLGVMYYELVAGRKPLGGRTLSELRNEHVQARIVPLNEIAPDVPPAFANAVMRAMAKDRNDRYSTAGEFTNDLRLALGMTPLAAHSASGSFVMDKSENGGDASASGGAATAHIGGRPSGAATVMTQNLPNAVPPGGAETIAISDAAATNAGRSAPPPPPVQPMATVAMNADSMPSAVSTPQIAAKGSAQTPAMDSPVVTPPATKSLALPIILGVVALLVVLGGVGGFLVWRSMQPAADGVVKNEKPAANTGVNANKTTPAAGNETLQYWIQLYDPKQSGAPTERKAGASIVLYTGDKITFDFKPREHGYFYIVGPGEKNAPTAILTAQLPNGLTNEAAANGLFKFPLGKDALELDPNVGTETYTIVFSPTPLTKPAFLAGKVFHKLTDAELTEFESFRALNAKSPDVTVKDEGGQPTTLVSVPQATQGQPVIFDIRIDHRAKK
jgi:serine/threonine protein kinase